MVEAVGHPSPPPATLRPATLRPATLRPSTLREAVELRARLGAVPFAGGTDLMVKLRRGAGALPAFSRPVLFLDRCEELARIEMTEAGLEIGSMVTLAALAESVLVHPVLREAVLEMGAPALRAVATLGGNVCNASPAGDTLPFLYAFDARVRLASPSGSRTIPIEELITGPGKTSLGSDELLRSVLLSSWSPSVALWRKVGTRKANALTKVSIAGFAETGADRTRDRIARVRIALGAVGPTVVRLRTVEGMLQGASADEVVSRRGLIRDAVRDAVRPIDDQRSTAEYRREVAAGLVGCFVEMLFGSA